MKVTRGGLVLTAAKLILVSLVALLTLSCNQDVLLHLMQGGAVPEELFADYLFGYAVNTDGLRSFSTFDPETPDVAGTPLAYDVPVALFIDFLPSGSPVAVVPTPGDGIIVADATRPWRLPELFRVPRPNIEAACLSDGGRVFVIENRDDTGQLSLGIADINYTSEDIAWTDSVDLFPDDTQASLWSEQNDTVYIAGDGALRVVTSPSGSAEEFSVAGSCAVDSRTVDLIVWDGYAFVLSLVGLEVVDVSNPANPLLLDSVTFPDSTARDMDWMPETMPGTLVVAATGQGLWLVDASDPSDISASPVAGGGGGLNGVAVRGDHVYATGSAPSADNSGVYVFSADDLSKEITFVESQYGDVQRLVAPRLP